jgi:hypothetical protein
MMPMVGFARSVCFARVGLAPGIRVPGHREDAVQYFVKECMEHYRSEMSARRSLAPGYETSDEGTDCEEEQPAETEEEQHEESRKRKAVLALVVELARVHGRGVADRDREAARAAVEFASVDQHGANAGATERAAARAVMVRAARGMEDVVEWGNLRRLVKSERRLKCKRFIVPYERKLKRKCEENIGDGMAMLIAAPTVAPVALRNTHLHRRGGPGRRLKFFCQNATDCGEEYEYMCALVSLSNAHLILGMDVVTPRALLNDAYQKKILHPPMLGIPPNILVALAISQQAAVDSLQAGDVLYVSGVALLNVGLAPESQFELPDTDSHVVAVESIDVGSRQVTIINPDRRKAGRTGFMHGVSGRFVLTFQQLESVWQSVRSDGTSTSRCLIRWLKSAVTQE